MSSRYNNLYGIPYFLGRPIIVYPFGMPLSTSGQKNFLFLASVYQRWDNSRKFYFFYLLNVWNRKISHQNRKILWKNFFADKTGPAGGRKYCGERPGGTHDVVLAGRRGDNILYFYEKKGKNPLEKNGECCKIEAAEPFAKT